MRYNIYKNYTDEQFLDTKKILERIKSFCIQRYSEVIKYNARADDSDHLNLNFTLITNSDLKGFFFLVFNEQAKFDVVLLMTFDKEKKRYYRKNYLAKDMDIEGVEKSIEIYLYKALDIYNQTSIQDVLNSDFEDIE